MYTLKDDDELVMTAQQLKEYKEIVEKETILKVAKKEIKN